MTAPQHFPGAALDHCGLNRQVVFNLAELPRDIVEALGTDAADYRQLILIGHGGTSLWEAVTRSGIASPDPIDDFTLHTIQRWMADELPGQRYVIVYPGSQTIPLQRLAALAGWHHATPFSARHRCRMGHLVRLPRGRTGRYTFFAHFGG